MLSNILFWVREEVVFRILDVSNFIACDYAMGRAEEILDAQLRGLANGLKEELRLQEAVLLAADGSISTLKEALSHEVDTR